MATINKFTITIMHEMRPEEIKAILILKGISAASIAKKHSVTRSAVHHVIHGRLKSARLAKEIAEIVGKPANKIWPSAYGVCNKSNKKTRVK